MCNDNHPITPATGASLPDTGEAQAFAAARPQAAGEAVSMMLAGLRWLANADLASVPVAVQAECLRELERAASLHTAARASVLSAFDAAVGYESDGQRSPRTWLRWQTRVTGASAAASVAWMRRLRAHQVVMDALRDGRISASWAREICDWTDRLPEEARNDADQILLAAAADGAELADLAGLAEEMRRRLAESDSDDDGFEDRQVRLQTTLDGAGRLDGNLTSRCAAALQAVLDALGKKTGPEDTRTMRQRHHDALEEAARRLIASGCLPDRAGQATQIQLHISLEELARQNQGLTPEVDPASGQHPRAEGTQGPDPAQAFGPPPADGPAPRHDPGAAGDWAFGRPQADGPAPRHDPGAAGDWAFGPAARPGDLCDATIIPIVTGRVDQDLLDRLTATLHRLTANSHRRCAVPISGQRENLSEDIRELILANAVALLSGPGQIASLLRTGTLAGPAATISLPLDLGTAADSIPPHLRRAVILRDKHCAAPGCFQSPQGCQVHHTTPRSKGGRTRLRDLILLCPFHHLIVVHEWGWTISLNADGTTTMRSPDGSKVYRSHSPPPATAA